MAAAAANAAQAAAQAVAAIAANQAGILATLTAQQNLLQQQFNERAESGSSRKEPEDLEERGAVKYNPWALGFTSWLAKRKRDWAIEPTDALMLAHPNYVQDAPPDLVNPAAQIAAQAEVLSKRRKIQTDLHDLLSRKCKLAYYAECSSIHLSSHNCGSLLWRTIHTANNPDGEEQLTSLRSAMTKLISSFSGEWEKWVEKIDNLQTQLTHLNEPFTDREFREHIFKATRKVQGWDNWTENKKGLRPALTYYEIKSAGRSKWAELNEGDISFMVDTSSDTKKEKAAMVFQGNHNPKNCKDAACTLDHNGLEWCSYHGKWTGHSRQNCQMLRDDIALQKEANHIRGRGGGNRGGDRGRGRGGGGRGGGYQAFRGGGRGTPRGGGRGNRGRGGGYQGGNGDRGFGGRRRQDEDDDEEEERPRKKRVNFANHIVHCAMVLDSARKRDKDEVKDDNRALIDSGCTSHLHPTKASLVNLRPCDKVIQFADESEYKSKWIGDWPVKAKDSHGAWTSTLFKNVLVCEPIRTPILSVQRMRVASC
jgi:hypothetical protein